MKKKKVLILSLVTFGLIATVVGKQVFAQVMNPVSYSEVLSYEILQDKIYTSSDYGIQFATEGGLVDIENENDVLPNVKKYLKGSQENGNLIAIRIIPLEIDPSTSALYNLETYLLKYVGLAYKYTQHENIMKGKEIAQISLNMVNNGEEIYYSLYSIIKIDNKAFIITTGLNSSRIMKDPFFDNDNSVIKAYNKTVESLKLSGIVKEFNQINRNNINQDFINSYKVINNKFKNSY